MLLGYGKLLVLKVFKNTLLNRLYWVLFAIDDLGLAVEMEKKVLKKEKIDRQLADQSTSIPLMKVRDGYNNSTTKTVTFNTPDRWDNTVDKLTVMISKLTAQGSKQDKQFKPKIYQGKRGDRWSITITEVITTP